MLDFNLLNEQQQKEYRDFEELVACPGWRRLVTDLQEDEQSALVRAVDSPDLLQLGYWKGCRQTLRTVCDAPDVRIAYLESLAVREDEDEDESDVLGLLP